MIVSELIDKLKDLDQSKELAISVDGKQCELSYYLADVNPNVELVYVHDSMCGESLAAPDNDLPEDITNYVVLYAE